MNVLRGGLYECIYYHSHPTENTQTLFWVPIVLFGRVSAIAVAAVAFCRFRQRGLLLNGCPYRSDPR